MNIHHAVCLITVSLCIPTAYCEDADAAGVFRQQCAALAQNAEKTGSMVVAGNDGWLFLTGELRHICAGKFWGREAPSVSKAVRAEAADPLPAILDFNAQLKKIGVKLLLVPVPPKAVIYPEMLPGFTNRNEKARLDIFHQEFYALLRTNGVDVLDLTDLFLQNKDDSQCDKAANKNTAGRAFAASPSSSGQDGASPHENLYCRQDSHWSGQGCALAAQKIAAGIKPLLGGNAPQTNPFRSEWKTIEIAGDLWQVLNDRNIVREKTGIRRIFNSGAGEPATPDGSGKIILLGDSHNLVFHAGDDMLFQGAGLPDQLAFELGFAVDLIAVRGSGATPARINLLRRARRNKDYWKSKKCVIWCFSAREFTESDGWRKAPIE